MEANVNPWTLYLGMALGVLFFVVDQVTKWWQRRGQPSHIERFAALDTLLQGMKARHQRIAALLDNLPSARRKRKEE